MKHRRPYINTTPGADQYAAPYERIVEFSFPNGEGGLISFAELSDGTCTVDIYRCSARVRVRTGGMSVSHDKRRPSPIHG